MDYIMTLSAPTQQMAIVLLVDNKPSSTRIRDVMVHFGYVQSVLINGVSIVEVAIKMDV
jgi:hypothetical protein